jgi:hypothetical protein
MTRETDRYLKERIERITEKDFWSSWTGRDPVLREAVRLGGAGRRAAAYRALAGFHRENTLAEWEEVRREAAGRNATRAGRARTDSGADDVRAGVIRGWHGRVIRFGRRIDFRANFGRSGQYGFHYLGWLRPLVDRAILDGDPRDLARVVEIAGQYYAQRLGIKRRIPRLHPVYYELGSWAKVNALLPAYLALLHLGSPAARQVEALLKLFLGFGRSLLRLQCSGYRSGNWQIVGSAGLFRLGAVFPRLREAGSWRRRATQMMVAHLKRDFYADGGHKERCWSYGWMSLRGVLAFYQLGRRTGFLSPSAARTCLRVIRRAFRWYLKTVTPALVCPAYGDGDLFDSGEIRAAAARYLPAAEVEGRCAGSVCLRRSGYAVMRDGPDPDGRYLNVNFGEWGGGHTHQDLLDLNVWAFGRPLIEEVGRFGGYDNPLDSFFRSPQAHNQVVIDDAVMDRRSASGQRVRWHSSAQLDYFSACHDAYRDPLRGSPAVARVHRHILFVRGGYWLIYDVVRPLKGETIFTVSSWLHSPARFRVTGPGLARTAGRVGCAVAFAFPDELRRLETGVDLTAGEVNVPRLHPPRHHLRARKWAEVAYRGSLRFAMLLVPFRGRPPGVSVRPSTVRGAAPGLLEAFEVRTPAGRDRVVFNPARRAGLRGLASWVRGRRRVVIP